MALYSNKIEQVILSHLFKGSHINTWLEKHKYLHIGSIQTVSQSSLSLSCHSHLSQACFVLNIFCHLMFFRQRFLSPHPLSLKFCVFPLVRRQKPWHSW